MGFRIICHVCDVKGVGSLNLYMYMAVSEHVHVYDFDYSMFSKDGECLSLRGISMQYVHIYNTCVHGTYMYMNVEMCVCVRIINICTFLCTQTKDACILPYLYSNHCIFVDEFIRPCIRQAAVACTCSQNRAWLSA